MRSIVAAALMGAMAGLSACTSGLMGLGDEAVRGAANGTRLGMGLSGSDRDALGEALAAALASDQAWTPSNWHNDRTGAKGMASAGPAFLMNVEHMGAGDLAAPAGLDTTLALEPAAGRFAVKSVANVRLGPSTNTPIIASLPKDTLVDVVGKAVGADWILIASGERILGYSYQPLFERRGEGAPVLAGGQPRPPTLCRRFKQEVALPDGRSDAWTGTACRDRAGAWEVTTANRGPAS